MGEDGQSFTSALMALLDSTGGGRSTKTALVTSEVSFWLGNEKVHQLTEIPSQLRVEIKLRNNEIKYAKYSNFTVTNQPTNYTLFVGFFSGTAKDKLAYHNGMSFSTRDRDNDKNSGNCAISRASAWWYNSCYDSDLNPPYGHSYYCWHWSKLLGSEMKLKPKN